jgi:hypothetical protein
VRCATINVEEFSLQINSWEFPNKKLGVIAIDLDDNFFNLREFCVAILKLVLNFYTNIFLEMVLRCTKWQKKLESLYPLKNSLRKMKESPWYA